MCSVLFSLSLLAVVMILVKAEKPVARTGDLWRDGRRSIEDPSKMVYNIEGNSVNEKQFLRRILTRASSTIHNWSHLSSTREVLKRSSRTRKSIFGNDNRINIGTSVEAQKYPYSTVVTLSSGCTGTLVGAQHVLTAAHCVHNGKRFLKQARKLRIGMLQRNGVFRWIRVRKIHLPKQWMKTSTKKRIKYDFALLKLKRPHGRPTMAIKASTLKRGTSMQFAGFYSDKISNTMWYSQCDVREVIKGAVLSYCDSAKGISGSGVRSNNAIVGVVSAIGTGRLRGVRHVFNVVITLSKRKVKKILKWMKSSRSMRRKGRRRRT